MPELFPDNKIIEKSSVEPLEVEEFFDKEAEILGAYGLKGDVYLERGSNGWAFDFENKKIIYDPNFFVERGYSLPETLFATTHELMAHCGELLRDPELILKEARRYSRKEHLHLLYNIFEDVLGNRRIVAELPFLEETRTKLYEEKLFKETDYRKNASHVQFVYVFIREVMVPGKLVEIGQEARAALDKLRRFGDDQIDILDLVTTPSIEPKDRFQIMRNIIEPIYLELYQKDLEEEKKNGNSNSEPSQSGKNEKKSWWPFGKNKGESTPSKGSSKKSQGKGGDRGEAEAQKKFEKEYQTYKDSHPEPFKPEDEEKLKKTLEALAANRGGVPSLDQAILEEWAKEHGLSVEDVLGYRKEYAEIAPLVAELREVFKQIISKRLKERWKISPQLETEGEVLDEETLVDAYVESTSGGQPAVFREIVRSNKEQEGYGSFDMTLVNDLSDSMNEGEKLSMDRKSKILFLEALADFQKEIKEVEYESGVALGLEVRTETRAFGDFGDTELKSLSPELSEKDRIAIWKRLHKGKGGTPDYLSLEAIEKSLTPEYEEELRSKRKRKVIIVLSDGESGHEGMTSEQAMEYTNLICERLRKKGIIILAFGMTASGASVKETYKPDAEVIEDIQTLPKAMQKVILKYTEDL